MSSLVLIGRCASSLEDADIACLVTDSTVSPCKYLPLCTAVGMCLCSNTTICITRLPPPPPPPPRAVTPKLAIRQWDVGVLGLSVERTAAENELGRLGPHLAKRTWGEL